MDHLVDDSREDRLIDELLFGAHRPSSGHSRATLDMDQQFAKPIEDEDIFGIDCNEVMPYQDRLATERDAAPANENSMFGFESLSGVRPEPYRDGLFNGELDGQPESPGLPELEPEDTVMVRSPIGLDKIFVDDYSDTEATNDAENIQKKRYETQISAQKQQAPPPLSPNQLKVKQLKEKILQQVRNMNLKPKKLSDTDCINGMIEIEVEHEQLVSNTSSKFIFHKLLEHSKKIKEANDKANIKWEDYKDKLIKRICAEKRKIWDSFQQPVDDFDDEEEFIEGRKLSVDGQESKDGTDEEADHEDENMEDEDEYIEDSQNGSVSDIEADNIEEEEEVVKRKVTQIEGSEEDASDIDNRLP